MIEDNGIKVIEQRIAKVIGDFMIGKKFTRWNQFWLKRKIKSELNKIISEEK